MTAFVHQASAILVDNKLTFFPAFTDHGLTHVERVIHTASRLMPAEAQELLTAEDVACLICSVVLHDLSMHLSVVGFIDVVSAESRFKPRPWFDTRHGDRLPDLPWHQSWENFRNELRHASPDQLDIVIGTQDRSSVVVLSDRWRETKHWSQHDVLIVGEFLRRHHARLSHEIAMYGFPAVEPSLSQPLAATSIEFGEIAGAIARSHNEPLRLMSDFLYYRTRGSLRTDGIVAQYLMAVLRIADYLQLDADRAPTLLRRSKALPTRKSEQEWDNHDAISSVSWDHRDKFGIYVQVDSSHSLRTHLQLADLFVDLQREFDTSIAVLSETYSASDLSSLALRKHRIYTNLHDEALAERLDYVPIESRLRSAGDLFKRIVADLYGRFPVVGARELLQNAVDAVRAAGLHAAGEDSEKGDPAIRVDLMRREGGGWRLTIEDSGVGMTPEVVANFFLTAGASLLPTFLPTDVGEEVTPKSPPLKAGRFGIGVVASFLLGPNVVVSTRPRTASTGLRFVVTLETDLVELTRVADLPVGTSVSVDMEMDSVADALTFLRQLSDFYVFTAPKAHYRFNSEPGGDPVDLYGPHSADRQRRTAVVPSPGIVRDSWRWFDLPESGCVGWRAGQDHPGELSLNGMAVMRPSGRGGWIDDSYQLSAAALSNLICKPALAIIDPHNQVELGLTRYSRLQSSLPFERQLLHSIGKDILANGLVSGPSLHPLLRQNISPIVGESEWYTPLPGVLADLSSVELYWEPMLSDLTESGPLDRYLNCLHPDDYWESAPFRGVLTSYLGTVPQGRALPALREQLKGEVERLGLEVVDLMVLFDDEIFKEFEPDLIAGSEGDDEQWLKLFVAPGVVGYLWNKAIGGAESVPAPVSWTPLLERGRVASALSTTVTRLVARCVPGGPQILGKASDDLSVEWHAALDGGIPRSPTERIVLASDLGSTDPSLDLLMRDWDTVGIGTLMSHLFPQG